MVTLVGIAVVSTSDDDHVYTAKRFDLTIVLRREHDLFPVEVGLRLELGKNFLII
jgi:hypothetical protein